MELIDELHPIAKTPLYVVYPGLRPFRSLLGCLPQMRYNELHEDREMEDLLTLKSQPTVKINGREVTKRKLTKIKSQISEKAVNDNPVSQLGFGIVAYLDILYSMVWAFIIFSLMLVPTLQAYKSGSGYDDSHYVGYANTMISNLGYSDVACNNIPVSLGSIVVSCNYGTVGKILDYGVNNEESGSPLDACTNNDLNRGCRPTSSSIGSLLDGSIGKERYSVQFS